ncbi:MAG: hypothetical protein IPJ23_02665 [Ignavibacteriales bacterium]|nr:hypothetical protein [Ignavibacteriales bacterium]
MKKYSSNIVSFCLILGLLFTLSANDLAFGQQFNKIKSDIPGGGTGTTNTQVESSDNTLLYVVGGAVVVGIVVYALMHDKKEKSTKDTTAAILNDEYLDQNLSLNEKILNAQSQIPINISFGMLREKSCSDEKRYFIGLNYNF